MFLRFPSRLRQHRQIDLVCRPATITDIKESADYHNLAFYHTVQLASADCIIATFLVLALEPDVLLYEPATSLHSVRCRRCESVAGRRAATTAAIYRCSRGRDCTAWIEPGTWSLEGQTDFRPESIIVVGACSGFFSCNLSTRSCMSAWIGPATLTPLDARRMHENCSVPTS